MHFISEVYWNRGERMSNQDTLSLQDVGIGKKRIVFSLICDGMGGLEEGEQASGYVAEQMTEWFYQEAVSMVKRHKNGKKLLYAGVRVLYECNERMRVCARERKICFGTTITALLLAGRRYYIWQSGDSALYRIMSPAAGKERMKRLTKGHSTDRHTLTRCIGSFPWQRPDIRKGRLLIKRNTFLLCSDGFWQRMDEEQLKTVLNPRELINQDRMGRRLAEIAKYVKRRGEADNLSAVVIRT